MKLATMMALGIFLCVGGAMAQTEEAEKILKPATSEEKPKENRRRKKVMMCHDCGKPEYDCECEGEGHGEEEAHGAEKES